MSDSEEPCEKRPPTAELVRRRLKWIVGVIVVTIVAFIAIFWSSNIGPAGRAAATKEIAESARILIRDCRLYAEDYNNRFPPHLAAIILRGTPTKFLVDPASQLPPPAQPPFGDPKNWQPLAPEIDSRAIFIYAGASVRSKDAPNIIVLYTRAGVIPRERVVGFVDGSVQLIPESQLGPIFEANNNARRNANRELIELDQR
jgi:hypothetical protein